jgi:hypothetical protein
MQVAGADLGAEIAAAAELAGFDRHDCAAVRAGELGGRGAGH